MERKNKFKKSGFSTILWAIMAIMLCIPSYGLSASASYDVPLNKTRDVGTGPDMDIEQILSADWWWVNVYGTLNTYDGAYIEPDVYVKSGGKVNIYAGTIGPSCEIKVPEGSTVTVYGTAFDVDNGSIENGMWTLPENTIGTLFGEYENGDSIELRFQSEIVIYLVDIGVKEIIIDIKPGSYPNSINLGSNGVIPVAILSSETFDATTVDPTTVELAGSGVAVRGKGKSLAHEEDVNGDDLLDLVVQVETENLDPDSESFQDGYAILTGETFDGVDFEGSDEISIVPPE